MLAAIVLILALPGGAGSAETRADSAVAPLVVYCENDPPNQYPDKDGRPAGFAVEVVEEIQRRTGHREPIVMVPWARGYATIQAEPGVVLFSMTRTAERLALFRWVGPILETVYGLYARADSRLVIHSLDDAKKLATIGVYKDDARDLLLTAAGLANLDRVADNLTNVKKLMAGRIDAFAESSVQVAADAEAAGFRPEDLKLLFAFKRVQLFIAMSRGTDPATVAAWNGALAAMKADGSFARIYGAYYPGVPLPGPALEEP